MQALVAWYGNEHRDLPWRRTADPYRIWVSEIMLQQTRAVTVIPYYERFLRKFPDMQSLANGDEQELLKAWEGLGYYSRARNLKKTAQIIMAVHNGIMPRNKSSLLALPGIGDYTASAVAAIAFGEPVAAVDGNFLRVWTRYRAWGDSVSLPGTKKKIAMDAERCMPREKPGLFANAMMELGATVCSTRDPLCGKCPLKNSCRAYTDDAIASYPVHDKKKPKRIEKRSIMLVFNEGKTLVSKRKEALLSGLYGFPDCEGWYGGEELCRALQERGITAVYEGRIGRAKHVFTHIVWEMEIHSFRLLALNGCGWEEVNEWELAAYPIPTALRKARELAARRLSKHMPFDGDRIPQIEK